MAALGAGCGGSGSCSRTCSGVFAVLLSGPCPDSFASARPVKGALLRSAEVPTPCAAWAVGCAVDGLGMA
jgi:hypothetical protein